MDVWRMFYVLKVYWLLCNNSCAESSSPFEHAKNWFLKGDWILPCVKCDWCKVYDRLAIRLKEKLARLNSKTNNIHDTKNEVFR